MAKQKVLGTTTFTVDSPLKDVRASRAQAVLPENLEITMTSQSNYLPGPSRTKDAGTKGPAMHATAIRSRSPVGEAGHVRTVPVQQDGRGTQRMGPSKEQEVP